MYVDIELQYGDFFQILKAYHPLSSDRGNYCDDVLTSLRAHDNIVLAYTNGVFSSNRAAVHYININYTSGNVSRRLNLK